MFNVLELFHAGSGPMEGLKQGVSSLAESFLTAKRIHAPADSETIRDCFRTSTIPEQPVPAEEYLEFLNATLAPYSTHVGCPKFMGHMTTALPWFVHDLGRLMLAMNQNTVKIETARAMTYCERQILAMLHRLIFGFGDTFYTNCIQDRDNTLGMVTSGGTSANLTAMWCARNRSLGPTESFAGVEIEGLAAALRHYGAKNMVVVGSSFMHYSFDKAAGVMGAGTSGLIKVPVDAANRIDLKHLRRALKECQKRRQRVIALIGVAGTTDSGAIDPIEEMAEIAAKHRIHFHVDAAWGGPVMFSERHAHKLRGIERADSVTIDGHKQLYMPMGIGLVLFRDPKLPLGIEKNAQYIVRRGSFDLGKRSLEGSRPAMALLLHGGVNLLGQSGYAALIDEGIRKVAFMAEQVHSRPEFEVLVEPQINILTYRYLPPEFRERASLSKLQKQDQEEINAVNEALQQRQFENGESFVSRTTLDTTRYGRNLPITALRAVIANPLTTEQDILETLDEQGRIGSEIRVRAVSAAAAASGGLDMDAAEGAA
jgi:glutamate decarboxylase